jgi:hypothetical protein
MTLTSKRKPLRSGILRAPKRFWPRHEAFVRRHQCVVPGCLRRYIEFAHLRTAANSGVAVKPASWFGVPLCGDWAADGQMIEGHHAEAHRIGHDTFAAKYGLDLWKLAEEFARHSPDLAMRKAMQENT